MTEEPERAGTYRAQKTSAGVTLTLERERASSDPRGVDVHFSYRMTLDDGNPVGIPAQLLLEFDEVRAIFLHDDGRLLPESLRGQWSTFVASLFEDLRRVREDR